MAKSDYLDPRWQQFRLKRLEASDWKCEACGSTEDTLHVHHVFYVAGRKPWEYLPETTLVLCEECHEVIQEFSADFDTFGADRWEVGTVEEIHRTLPHSFLRKSTKT